MKYVFLIIFAAIIAGYVLLQTPTLINEREDASLKSEQIAPTESHAGLKTNTHNHAHEPSSPNDLNKQTSVPEGKTGNPHFDQLSPEMQQAAKDSLLLEGPMETYERADGSIVLPANGRFTQMPVAVEMPDGSIEIREYSVVPKADVQAEK
jgi:hypothetical protein